MYGRNQGNYKAIILQLNFFFKLKESNQCKVQSTLTVPVIYCYVTNLPELTGFKHSYCFVIF